MGPVTVEGTEQCQQSKRHKCNVTWLCFKANCFIGYSKLKDLVLNWLNSHCIAVASARLVCWVLFCFE